MDTVRVDIPSLQIVVTAPGEEYVPCGWEVSRGVHNNLQSYSEKIDSPENHACCPMCGKALKADSDDGTHQEHKFNGSPNGSSGDTLTRDLHRHPAMVVSGRTPDLLPCPAPNSPDLTRCRSLGSVFPAGGPKPPRLRRHFVRLIDADRDSSDSCAELLAGTERLSLSENTPFPGSRRGSVRRASVNISLSEMQNGGMAKYHPRKRLSTKYDSMDYNAVESQHYLTEQEGVTAKGLQQAALMRWVVNFIIGLYVAIIAVIVAMLIKYISLGKFTAIYKLTEDCRSPICLLPGLLAWCGFNAAFVFLGAYLVTYHAPQAAGSGIPQVKCYLNGIKLPGLLSLRTLLAKAGGIVLSVSGGLLCGKEGPMIHSGAICASGMARAEFRLCGKEYKPSCCDGLRTDEERRDFVCAGTAAGVSAAFGSPVGGVLFALEEGASFLKQQLTWRMMFSSMTAGLFLNLIMSAVMGHPEDMSQPGLVSLGYLGDISFKTFELPIFMAMAVIGGLGGALFVQLNYKITLFRRRVITKNWMKVLEAIFVSMVTAIVLMVLIYVLPDCHPIKGLNITTPGGHGNSSVATEHHNEHNVHRRSSGSENEAFDVDDIVSNDTEVEHHDIYGNHGHGFVYQGFCPYGQHNRMADILFKTPEAGLHHMLHAPLEEWTMLPLFILVIFYHLLTTWTYGLNVSSGLFIPSLLIGGIWGRIVGMVVMKFIPSAGTNIAKYVLVGASCQLSGFVRMTISLTVIIIECTGDITFGLPIILAVTIAKWMGDYFNPGIYDMHIEIWGVPLLGWEAPDMCFTVTAREVMTGPVISVLTNEKIERLNEILGEEDAHNGYPVVDDYDHDSYSTTYGRLRGFILAEQIKAAIKRVSNDDDKATHIDLRSHMECAPLSITEEVSLPRIFKLFRGLGMRHLTVVNERNRVVGMITRINLARFRSEVHKGHFKTEELELMEN